MTIFIMDRQFALSAVLLLAALQQGFAFSPSARPAKSSLAVVAVNKSPLAFDAPMIISRLRMTAETDGEETPFAEDADAAEEEEAVAEASVEEEEEEEPKEDPEITALKEEISKLESTLKTKRSTLGYTQDQAEEYSKGGYARKVAEMENMRRKRSTMNSSNRSSAKASVLADFLPLYDKMSELKEKYAVDEFGAKYGGLWMGPTLTKMGVEDYTVEAGATLDNMRMAVLESEHSADFAKDTVIRLVNTGLELEGNVIRAAECIASLGPEEEAKAADEAENNDEDAE